MNTFTESYKHHYRGTKKLPRTEEQHDARSYLQKSRSVLDVSSLSRIGVLISLLELSKNAWKKNPYYVFTVEPLYLPHLGISKRLRECTVHYIAVNEKDIVCATNMKPKQAASCRIILLNTCNDLLSAYQKVIIIPRVQIDF